MTKSKAFSYLRVSGKGQIKGDGFPRQRAAIRAYAKAHRMTIVDEFTDAGVSGTKELQDRAGLAALLDRAEHNGGSVVLVETASRLARDLMVSEIILQQFRACGVKVIAVDADADLTGDTNDPTSTLIRQVLGAVSQFEKSVVVMKLRASRDRKSRKAGKRVEGVKPFGHFADEEATLARLQSLGKARSCGRRRWGYAGIARILNDEGRATRRGGAWTRQTVRAILA